MATIYVWKKYTIEKERRVNIDNLHRSLRLSGGKTIYIFSEFEAYRDDPDGWTIKDSSEVYSDPINDLVESISDGLVPGISDASQLVGYYCFGPDSDLLDGHDAAIITEIDTSRYNEVIYAQALSVKVVVDTSAGIYISEVTSSDRTKYPDNGMDSNEEYWYIYQGVQNTAPTTPSSITVPSTLKENAAATISWGSSTDSDGNLSGYILEQKLNGGSWTQVYKGSARSKSITPQASWNTVAYRVKAYDTENAMSSYKTSASVTVQHNSAPSMPEWCSVPNPVKGGTSIKITWPASTDPDNNLSGYILERKFNSNSWTQIYKGANRSYTDPIPLDKYKTVTYRVKAYDTKNAQSAYATSVTRTIQNSTVLQFRLKTPIESSKRARYGQEIMTYTIPSGATFKAEACNNGFDENPTWEDITESVKKQKIFEFANKTKTASKWGYDIRVTIDRNGATGNCYFTRGNGFFEEEE